MPSQGLDLAIQPSTTARSMLKGIGKSRVYGQIIVAYVISRAGFGNPAQHHGKINAQRDWQIPETAAKHCCVCHLEGWIPWHRPPGQVWQSSPAYRPLWDCWLNFEKR